MSRIAILGAGALGTALSIALHKRDRSITLWTIEHDVAAGLKTHHENTKYLPGFLIPPSIHVTLDLPEAIEEAQAAIIAVPSHAVREVAKSLATSLPEETIVICASKGLEEVSWLRMSQVIGEEFGAETTTPTVSMSGPCLAVEMARGAASAVDLASENLAAARQTKKLLATSNFKMRPMSDVAGVEVGGTFKNGYAIGAGVGDGLGWGMNERSAYLTRALGEIARLASALGARRSTIYGLSGLGDLTVTCFSPTSRNRRVGEELARGRHLRDILASSVSVAEGVAATRAAHALAVRHHLRLPLAESLHHILHDGADPKIFTKALKTAT